MIDDDDPWANIDDEQPTQHIRTERAVPPQSTQPQQQQPQPSAGGAGGSSSTRWLIALGIVALLAILAAGALGASRAGWKDRAEKSEAKLELAESEAADAATDTVAPGDVVVPEGDEDAPDMTEPETPKEPDADATDDATDAVSDCDDFGLDGQPDPDGGAYYSISTRGIDCDAAKELILGRGFDGDGRAEAEGYTCARLSKVDETTEWRCEKDAVAFRYSFGL